MGFRFHRSVRLLPGVRLNLGLRGMSVTAGIPGLSVNVGPRGVYRNLGLPGTGLSHRERIDTPGRDASTMGPPLSSDTSVEPNGDVRLRVQLSLDANGRLVIRDTSGGELAPAIERRLRAEQADGLFAWLDQREHEIDAGFDELSAIHLHTPSPEWSLPHTPEPFDVPEPAPPAEITVNLWDRIMGRAEAKAAEQEEATAAYDRARTEWRRAREAHDRAQAAWPAEMERQLRTEPEVMERALEDALDAITWPRATHVRFRSTTRVRASSSTWTCPSSRTCRHRMPNARRAGSSSTCARDPRARCATRMCVMCTACCSASRAPRSMSCPRSTRS